VNSFHRRIGINGVEENQTRVQIVARANLEFLPGGRTVANQNDVVCEGPNFYGPPGNFLDHAGMSL
jgi:hypothetical protein